MGNSTLYIVIYGQARSGKDTIGDLMRAYLSGLGLHDSVKTYALADYIKNELNLPSDTPKEERRQKWIAFGEERRAIDGKGFLVAPLIHKTSGIIDIAIVTDGRLRAEDHAFLRKTKRRQLGYIGIKVNASDETRKRRFEAAEPGSWEKYLDKAAKDSTETEVVTNDPFWDITIDNDGDSLPMLEEEVMSTLRLLDLL